MAVLESLPLRHIFNHLPLSNQLAKSVKARQGTLHDFGVSVPHVRSGGRTVRVHHGLGAGYDHEPIIVYVFGRRDLVSNGRFVGSLVPVSGSPTMRPRAFVPRFDTEFGFASPSDRIHAS